MNDNMAKSIKKNYVFNLIYQLILIVIPLISIPYLSRILLEDGVGIFSYSESIVSYFVLFAILGSTTYSQREIGKEQNNIENRSRTFWEIFIVRLVTSATAICAYSIYLIFLNENFIIGLIFVLNIINVLVDVTWYFQGIEEFGKVATFGLISKLLDFAFIFIFVKAQSDLWIYALGKCGFIVLGNLGLWFLLPRKLCKVSNIKPFKHIKKILVFFIPTIAVQVYMMLDKSMIGWFTKDSAENGYYDYAEKIIRISITVIYALSTVLIPRISKANSEGDYETIKNIVDKALSYVWMLSIPLMLGFIAVSDIFVPVYFGENFLKSAFLMKVFTPLILFVGMASIIGTAYLIPIEKQNVYIVSVTIAAVINVILNCILIPRYASLGAAISSVVAEGVGVTIQCCYVFKKKMVNVKTFFLCSIKYWLSGGIMFAVLFIIKIYIPVAVWSLIVIILTGVTVYFLCLFVFRDKFFLYIIKKVLNIFKRNVVSEPSEPNNAGNKE